LIAEAWLSSQVARCKRPKVISKAVRRGMVDYMRKETKNRNKFRPEFIPISRISADFFKINASKNDNSGKASTIDYFDTLLKGFSRADKFLMKAYYLSGLTQQEIGKAIGISHCTVFYHHEKIIERLRLKLGAENGH